VAAGICNGSKIRDRKGDSTRIMATKGEQWKRGRTIAKRKNNSNNVRNNSKR